MAEIKIPTRPKEYDKSAIKKADADCLTYSVLMGCKNEDAFRLFHPEYLDADGKLNRKGKESSKQFFMYAKNKEYIDAYKAELAELFKNDSPAEHSTISESRKEKALKALLHQAMSIVEGNANLDPETLKIATEIFKKIGLLKDEEIEIEVPRRYLPQSCLSGCAYRLFVESHIESGEIISECDYCRTRKFAEENGWHFDLTKNLELPQDKKEAHD